MQEYDVVIAGCGISGAIAGLTALERDLEVCIVERLAQDDVGRKICGDLMLQKSTQWIKQRFGISVQGYPLKGLEIRSSGGNILHVPIPLCTVNRWHLGQGCVQALLDRGCSLHRGAVRRPVKKNGSVAGVKTKKEVIHGSVTIDSSGVSAIVRRKIPLLSFQPDALGLAYREILWVKDPPDMEYGILWFDKHLIPAGYFWCFPKNIHEVNVGAGGLVKGHVQLKQKLAAFVKRLGMEIHKKKDEGWGVVPLGRSLASQVTDGLLVCGDAANHVNPLTGEGIAPALQDGYDAGVTASEAIQNTDTSLRGLWKYNITYAQGYGKVHAPLILLRDFLISLTDEELHFFLETLINGRELGDILEGTLPSVTWRTVSIVLSHLKRLGLCKKAYAVLQKMRQVHDLYTQFPSEPAEFFSWKNTRDGIMGNTVKR
ncbi:MAG: NAD(P)/FAD-dependent oxidoreductase [Candidatus Thorarchaeota archaeon]|jgi:flavin-dependent dehydrogenase